MADLRPHATIHRGITSYSFCYEKEGTYGTITNMMGIILITLYKKGPQEKWNRTQIINGNGTIEAKDQDVRSVVGSELNYILKTGQEASKSMSNKRKEKIIDKLKTVGDKIEDYSVYKDWISDHNIKKR